MENGLEQQVLAKAQKWLDGNYDAETKKQVKYLMDNDMKELVESFYKDLEFGTGGLRGVMGVGTNRMNIYTVGAATQGLSNYLKRNFAGEEIRVVVGHDSRTIRGCSPSAWPTSSPRTDLPCSCSTHCVRRPS